MADVRLVINGVGYGGWTEVRIERGLSELAASFELRVTERWPEQPTVRPVRAGDACQIFIDDALELTGYVDDVVINYSESQHDVTVIGRDRTADIIDSSAPIKNYVNRTLYQIATDLCDAQGIRVISEVDLGAPFKKFAVEPGASIFDVIEKAARHRAVLMMSDTLGNLIFTRSGKTGAAAPIRLGGNALRCQALFSHRERFNTYRVYAQNSGGERLLPGATSRPFATARDDNIRASRALTVIAESADADLKQRAQWESSVRYGRGQVLEYTVQGWVGREGQLWQPNTLVEIDDAWVGIRETWLITHVRRILSNDEGTVTELQVMPKEAFDVIALPEDKNKNGFGFPG